MKTKLCMLAATALAIWSMKRFYSGARAEDLRWILGPTARIVGIATGTSFVAEPGQGYLSRERLFLIEKSCAGINFLIAAFGMLAFGLCRRIESCLSGAGVLVFSIVAAYASAVVVNAVRIAIAIWMAEHPTGNGVMTAAGAHRIEGIAVYFCGLVLLYEIVQRFEHVTCGRAAR